MQRRGFDTAPGAAFQPPGLPCVRDAEGGAEGAGTALSPRSGRRDCRSGSGARSSPTPWGRR
ncbi:MAG: hypothetical protein N2050_04525 [Flavobacteriales bacterium]|nr:hypothetical protein [Flavobacteriales bacterium]